MKTNQSRSYLSKEFPGRVLKPAWLICIFLSSIIFLVWGTAVKAQTTTTLNLEDLQVTINTIWVLIASVLVIFMNAGFAMLETGFCRQKNAVNVLSKNLIVFALSTASFWILGFSLMFGTGGNDFWGMGALFLGSDDPKVYGVPNGLPVAVFFLFQVAFAGTAATIVSGAVAERIKFIDFLLFSLVLVGLIYAITGHWIWGGGWLAQAGFKDFAGSTQVHSVGGWSALMGAILLGPRMEKYIDGRINALPGHNMSIATLGCLILWVGWFGFNPGSVLAATKEVPVIAVVTNLSAAFGGLAATVTSWIKDGKPDLSMIINGILAGLVGITAGCNGVSYWSAALIGTISGIIVVFAVYLFDMLRVDDPVGAISVHLVCGIWGTLAVGIFNNETGLITGQFQQMFIQLTGIISVGTFTIITSGLTWLILKYTLGIRVSLEEELEGLDIGEHGMEAYSGFVKEADVIFHSNPLEEEDYSNPGKW
ncbi:MAG: Ammonia channel [Chroococcopsis gigantea SAG 12.99]|jgi:Amt family ammonium transporter|nr:ammonium transporter [Chlorogloea purpurea SAG 13.99]MDV3000309.1 Ammonia channel [Chroococcopsis gigantea SAG 12.99]